jgi:hypothetical protein
MSDKDAHFWDGDDWSDWDIEDDDAYVKFDKSVLDFLRDGSCGSMLREALVKLPKLRHISLRTPPLATPYTRLRKINILKRYWSTAVMTVYLSVFAAAPTLETLDVLPSPHELPTCVPVLSEIAIPMQKTVSLTKFGFNVELNVNEDESCTSHPEVSD